MEARGGIEPPIELLQSSALPLGDRAFKQEGGRCKESSGRASPENNLTSGTAALGQDGKGFPGRLGVDSVDRTGGWESPFW